MLQQQIHKTQRRRETTNDYQESAAEQARRQEIAQAAAEIGVAVDTTIDEIDTVLGEVKL